MGCHGSAHDSRVRLLDASAVVSEGWAESGLPTNQPWVSYGKQESSSGQCSLVLQPPLASSQVSSGQ